MFDAARIIAAALESIAHAAESVDATVPILCGMAANRLYTVIGATAIDLPEIVDHPDAIRKVLDQLAAALSESDDDQVALDVWTLVEAARHELRRS